MANRKILQVDQITISYLEQNETEQSTIFFIHGNSCSSNMWSKQFEDKRFDRYRLIAADLPSHGDSGLILPERNSVIELASILYQVIAKLKLEKLVLVGFSLGANLAAEILNYTKHPEGIALISPTIVGENSHLGNIGQDGATWGVLFENEPLENHLEAFCKDSLAHEIEYKNVVLEDYQKVKPGFRFSLLQSALSGQVSDEIRLIKEWNKEVLIVFGSEERFVKTNYLNEAGLKLWRDNIHKLEGSAHSVSIDQPEVVNSLILEYANSCL